MSKLYEVTITAYVIADNPDDAVKTCLEECQEGDAEVFKATAVEWWWPDLLPYGGDGKKTRKQYLLEQKQGARHTLAAQECAESGEAE